jgi:hypothetical protein
MMIVAVHAAGEGGTRAGRDVQLGLGAAAGGEVITAVDDGDGEGAVVEGRVKRRRVQRSDGQA